MEQSINLLFPPLSTSEICEIVRSQSRISPQSYFQELQKISLQAVVLQAGQQLDDYFICKICAHIVQEPIECASCELCFCQKCVKLMSKQACPQCNQVFEGQELKKVNRNQLDQIELKCPNGCCEDPIKYSEFKNHLRVSCPKKTIICPLLCDKVTRMEEGLLNEHIKVCPNVLVQCKGCDSQVFQSHKQEHNCTQVLKEELKQSRQLIEDQKRKISQLETQPQQPQVMFHPQARPNFPGSPKPWAFVAMFLLGMATTIAAFKVSKNI